MAGVAAVSACVQACSDANPQRVALATATAGPPRQRPAVRVQSSSGYRVAPLAAIGRIKGVVEFGGVAPADTVVHSDE